MRISPYAALDAGVPTDAEFVGHEPDNRGREVLPQCDTGARMMADVRYVWATCTQLPDKILVADCLARLGYAAADIIENIDDIMREISLWPTSVRAVGRPCAPSGPSST